MTNISLRLCVAVLAIVGCATAWAQKPAQIDLGFKADGLYQYSGLDSVNLFNGNLIVQIPIGSPYAVGGNFKYGLTLVYNSKVWDYDQTPGPNNANHTTAYPNWRSNAGVGWRLSLGRLIGSTDPTTNAMWIYEGPTGEEHTLVKKYKEDGTPDVDDGNYYSVGQDRLRLTNLTSSTVRLLEFPNGDVHKFVLQCENWHLAEMRDAFGNSLTITTTCDSDARVWSWHLYDSAGRTHEVHFEHHLTTENSIDRGQHVKSVTLSTVAGPLTYDFEYEADAQVDWGCDHLPVAGMGFPARASLPLLKRISLPEETAFTFDYYRTNSGGFCSQGAMRTMTVPTGGTFEYRYQQMDLPEDVCWVPQFANRNPGVSIRKTPDGRWDYVMSGAKQIKIDPPQGGEHPCSSNTQANEMRTPAVNPIRRWARTSVLAPPVADSTGAVSRVRTDNYFYTYPHDAPVAKSDAWNYKAAENAPKLLRYGQAMTTGAPPAAERGPVRAGSTVSTDVEDADARVLYPESPPAAADVNDPLKNGTHYLSTRLYTGCADESSYPNADTSPETVITARCENGSLVRSAYQRYGYPVEGIYGVKWLYPAESSLTLHHDDTSCGGICWTQNLSSGRTGYGTFKTTKLRSNFSYPDGPRTDAATTTNYLPPSGGKWFLHLYDQTIRDEGGQKAIRDFWFDPNTGFLNAVRTRAGEALASHDVLTFFSGTKGNVEVEEIYGGDAHGPVGAMVGNDLPVGPSPFVRGGTRQSLIVNSFSHGVLSKSRACVPSVSGTACTSLLTTFDVTIHPSGAPLSSRDSAGVETTYQYDTKGRLHIVTSPTLATSTYTYLAASPTRNTTVRETVASSEGIRLSETLYEFDRVGRVSKTTRSMPDQKTSTVTVMYDAHGRKVQVTQPKGETDSGSYATTTKYDVQGRPVEVKAPDGKVTTLTYGGERWVQRATSVATTSTGETAVTVKEYYDAQRRLIRVEEFSDVTNAATPKGGLTSTNYDYDVGGRLTKVTMGDQLRTFKYDMRGFLLEELHPESGLTKYKYDARGHVRSKTDANNTTLRLDYDAADRLTTILKGSTVLKSYAFGPDGASDKTGGKLIKATRRNEVSTGVIEVTERYEYHPFGQLARRTTEVDRLIEGGASVVRQPIQKFAHTVDYDPLGLPKTIGMPTCSEGGCSTALGLTSVSNEREAGLLKTVTGFASLTYASSGMVETVQHQLANARTETDTYESSFGIARPSKISLAGEAACPTPAPAIQSAGTICPGKDGTASVTAVDGTTYLWTIDGGTFTSSATTPTIGYRALAGGTVQLRVKATNSCGVAVEQSKDIAVNSTIAAPVITAPQSACANTTVTASVPVNPDVTYVWTMSPGTWTAQGAAVSFVAPDTSFTLTVTATSSCSTPVSASKQIEVAPAASAQLYLINPNYPPPTDPTRVRGSSEKVTLKVVFPGSWTGPWELLWSDGVRETTSQYANPHERIVAPEVTTEYEIADVSPQRCGGAVGRVTVKVLPRSPQSVTATTQADGKVFITWSSVPGAAGYVIERAASSAQTTGVEIYRTTSQTTSFLYTPPATTTPAVHLYYVRTLDPDPGQNVTGELSRRDTYDTAITGAIPVADTYISKDDIHRLRVAIDAYRTAFGIPKAFTTTLGLTDTDVILAAHVNELVVKLSQARTVPFAYRDVPPPQTGGFFYREHLQQLWEALR